MFGEFPDAFCYTVLKLREARREGAHVLEFRKLKKPHKAISTEDESAAMLWTKSNSGGAKQTKAEEHAAAKMRSIANREEIANARRLAAMEKSAATSFAPAKKRAEKPRKLRQT